MSNGITLMTTTLPTVVGMGVVSKATSTMFSRGRGRRKQARATHIVGISPTRAGAEKYATKYRKALKKQGLPYIGRVNVKKVSGGYAALYRR